LHAFILNACTEECERLGFIEVYRENKEGIAKNGGGKGTRRIYKLTLENVSNADDTKPPLKPEPKETPAPAPNRSDTKSIHESVFRTTSK